MFAVTGITGADLIAQVWPDTIVVEGALRVHIATLRKALGDGQLGLRYVENVTGHGYRFVAPLKCLSSTSASCDRKDTAGQALPPTNSDS